MLRIHDGDQPVADFQLQRIHVQVALHPFLGTGGALLFLLGRFFLLFFRRLPRSLPGGVSREADQR